MEDIYKRLPLKDIPWNFATPPKALTALVHDGTILPCKAIELGCGAGNYTIYLAKSGFDVTGIDLSSSAIKLARANARKKNASCRFIVGDVASDLDDLTGSLAFAHDWEVLHHIFLEKRKKYVENVHRILQTGGQYLSVCFHENDPNFNSSEKYLKTPLGTALYFSSEDQLRKLFEPLFRILELKTFEISGRPSPHIASYFLMMKGNTKKLANFINRRYSLQAGTSFR